MACEQYVPINKDGKTRGHYPDDPRLAFDGKPGFYCIGAGVLSAGVGRPSPSVAALMDPEFGRSDFFAALGKVIAPAVSPGHPQERKPA